MSSVSLVGEYSRPSSVLRSFSPTNESEATMLAIISGKIRNIGAKR